QAEPAGLGDEAGLEDGDPPNWGDAACGAGAGEAAADGPCGEGACEAPPPGPNGEGIDWVLARSMAGFAAGAAGAAPGTTSCTGDQLAIPWVQARSVGRIFPSRIML